MPVEDRVTLRGVQAGPDDGTPVVLLHGFPELWWGWHRQIDPLAEAGFRVLAPDQRGYNRSDKPTPVRSYRLDRLADDIAELIRREAGGRASVAGHDWGGAVAWWLAARHPGAVERLAVLNCPHPVAMRDALLSDPAQLRRSWYIFFFQLPWLPERWLARKDFRVAEKVLRSTSRPGTFTDDDLARYRAAWSRPGALRSMLHWYRAALRHAPRGRAGRHRVAAPARLLWGCRDRALRESLIGSTLALCDEGGVRRFPDATHWLAHEEAPEVSRELIRWFGAGRADHRPTGLR